MIHFTRTSAHCVWVCKGFHIHWVIGDENRALREKEKSQWSRNILFSAHLGSLLLREELYSSYFSSRMSNIAHRTPQINNKTIKIRFKFSRKRIIWSSKYIIWFDSDGVFQLIVSFFYICCIICIRNVVIIVRGGVIARQQHATKAPKINRSGHLYRNRCIHIILHLIWLHL